MDCFFSLDQCAEFLQGFRPEHYSNPAMRDVLRCVLQRRAELLVRKHESELDEKTLELVALLNQLRNAVPPLEEDDDPTDETEIFDGSAVEIQFGA